MTAPAAPTLSFTAQTVPQATVASFTSAAALSQVLTPQITGAFTIECWVKPGGPGGAADTLFWLTSGSSTLALSNPGNLTIALGGATLPTGVALAAGVWQHVSLAVSAPLGGKLAVLLLVDSATAFQAPAALAAPAGWLGAASAQTIGLGTPGGAATALAGNYAEFRLWSEARTAAAIVTDAWYQLDAAGAEATPGLRLAWHLAALPAGATASGVTVVPGAIAYRAETLSVSWAPVSGATYNLNVYANDHSWGLSYSALTAASKIVTGFQVDHGVSAVLQTVQSGIGSEWSPVSSGQIFRLGVPALVAVATSPATGAPTYGVTWAAVSQADLYWAAVTQAGHAAAPVQQASLSLDLTPQLGSATAYTVAIAAGSGIVTGPYSPAAAPATPVVTLTYTVSTEGQAGSLMLNWTAVEGATSYYVAWSAVGTGTLPAVAAIVDAGVTSAGPFTPPAIEGITYTATVQALSAEGLGASGTAALTILPVTAPTGLGAVTAPTGTTPGKIELSWAYAGPVGTAGYAVAIAQDNGDFTANTTSTTTSATFTDASFTAANWYSATVRYSAGGITGPAATMTVYVLPVPGGFSASWNPGGDVISASYQAVDAAGVSGGGATLAYETTIRGPLTNPTDCTSVVADPAVDTTLEATTKTTPSWPQSAVPGLDHSKSYSATVRTAVQGNASTSVASPCVVLKPYVAPVVPPSSHNPPTSDPIGITTGAFAYSATRLDQGAVVPIAFTINYVSQFPTHAEQPAIADGALGQRWRHDFETELVVDVAGGIVTVILGSMEMSSYYYSALPGELSTVGPFQGTRLYRTGSGYQLVFPDQAAWSFDADGLALAFADAFGNSLALSYASGRLASVALAGGTASIAFGYDGNGKLESVTGSGGDGISLSVTGNLLRSLTVPGSGTWQYSYASSGSALLEQVVDPWGNVEVHNDYDGSGRVIRQFTAEGYAANPRYSTGLAYGTASYQDSTVGTTTVTQPEGGVTIYLYDPVSLIVVRKSVDLGANAAGIGISEIVTIAYDGYYQPVRSTLYRGPTASYQAGQGNATSYAYNANRMMSQVIDASGRSQHWSYDDANNLTAYEDIWGNTTSYSYDGHLLLAATTPMGLTTRYAYWPVSEYGFGGLPKTVTDAFGNVTSIDYFGGTGLPKSITDPDLSAVAYTYDSAGRQNSEAVLGSGGARLSYTRSTYDGLGQVTLFTVQMDDQPAAAAYSYIYAYDTPTPNSVRVTYPADTAGDHELTLALNRDRNPVSRIYPAFDGVTVSRSTGYDKNGLIASVALGARAPTTYAYNALDELVSVTDPLGNVRTTARQQIVDGSAGPYPTEQIVTAPVLGYLDSATGLTTSYLYTETTVTDPGGLLTGQTWTLAPLATPDAPVWKRSTAWSYATATAAAAGASPAYQALTVTTATTAVTPAGSTITSSQTFNGEYLPVSATDARGHATTTAYAPAADPAGGTSVVLKKTVVPPAGASVDLYYDSSSRLFAYAAGSGAEARAALYAYDAMSRVVQVRVGDTLANLAAGVLTASGAAETGYSYHSDSSAGVSRMRVDATQPSAGAGAGVALSTYYDAFDRVVDESFAGGGSYMRSYAPWGSVAGWTTPSGGQIVFGFDSAGAMTSAAPSGSETISHVLDASGNRLETYLGTALAVSRTFDSWNRLTSRTAGGATFAQTQWPNGLLRSLTYPDARKVSYAIDGFGRWSAVTDWSARTTAYAYSATGQLESIAFPNRVVVSYDYDPSGSPSAFAVTTAAGMILTRLAYTPNQHGEPGAAVGIWPMPPSLPASEVTLTYSNDTLTEYGATALASNADAALTQIPAPDGGSDPAAVTYLDYGPLATVGDTRYLYDADGMLVGATRGEATSSYVVAPNGFQDPLLNMASPARSVADAPAMPTGTGGTALRPLHGDGSMPAGIDQAIDMILQISGGGAPGSTFVHAHGPVSQEQADGTMAYFHADPAGNMVALTDQAGSPAGLYVYGPYGAVRAASAAPALYGFAGRFGVTGDDSGLLAMRARFFAPQLMRFTSRDLLAGDPYLPSSRNRFAYGIDNPLVYADPLGLSFWSSLKSAFNTVTNILSGFRKALTLAASAVLAGALTIGRLFPRPPAGYSRVPTVEPEADAPPPRPGPSPGAGSPFRSPWSNGLRLRGRGGYSRVPSNEIELTRMGSSSSVRPNTPRGSL